jgi:hypothetical protein
MGRFRRFHCEWLSAHGWLRRVFLAQIQEPLLRRQFLEQVVLSDRSVEESVGTQQHGRIGQQGHAPSQTQTVEKHLAQPQLVFLIRLCRFNPRAHLLEQSLGRQTHQRQQAQQGFMVIGSKRKLAPTTGCFPAALAKDRLAAYAKPMPIFQWGIFQPAQRLALVTLGSVGRDIRGAPVSY